MYVRGLLYIFSIFLDHVYNISNDVKHRRQMNELANNGDRLACRWCGFTLECNSLVDTFR